MTTFDSFTALGSAIYNRLGTVQYTYDNGGTALVTSTLPLYDTLAPQGTNPPYNIFQLLDSFDDYVMTNKGGESIRVMVKTISDRLYAGQQGYPIYATLHGNLQNAPLGVDSMTLLRCQRTGGRFSFRDDLGYWNTGGIYRVEIWPSQD